MTLSCGKQGQIPKGLEVVNPLDVPSEDMRTSVLIMMQELAASSMHVLITGWRKKAKRLGT